MIPQSDLRDLVINALEDIKGNAITCIDVTKQTEIADYMVIVSGTSNRHVKALADNVIHQANQEGMKPIGLEGTEDAEWILIDLNSVVVHVMSPKARDFYDLERLWSFQDLRSESSSKESSMIEH